VNIANVLTVVRILLVPVFVACLLTVLRFVVIGRGVIAASQGGKLKTLLQIAAICLYILPPELSPPAVVREVVMAVAVVVTLVTGADYVLRAVRLYRAPAYGQDGGGADG
jgi:CDP-diacylglycerol--glycerol-3-phosphate 3-phosphatidyltransferase